MRMPSGRHGQGRWGQWRLLSDSVDYWRTVVQIEGCVETRNQEAGSALGSYAPGKPTAGETPQTVRPRHRRPGR